MQMETVSREITKRATSIPNAGRRTFQSKERGEIVGVRDLMVHLDGTEEDEMRLAHAEAIATLSGAHLTGIYTNLLPDYWMLAAGDAAATTASGMLDVEERVRREGDLVQARLKERFSRIAVPNELRRIECSDGAIAGAVAAEARWSDLFVATCPYRDGVLGNWDDVAESVLFASGHGVYFVPPGSGPRSGLNRILVAWTDTREAARAIAEAAPFLRATSDAEIVIVNASDEQIGARGYAAVDIAAHLDRHGVKIDIRLVSASKQSVSEAILDEARKSAADLIVMGAYGHSRLREWIIGGTTRAMLASAEVPILMAH